jgi:hypothetical protein
MRAPDATLQHPLRHASAGSGAPHAFSFFFCFCSWPVHTVFFRELLNKIIHFSAQSRVYRRDTHIHTHAHTRTHTQFRRPRLARV